MPINSDLFMSILAMDSYNRGYGAGISGLIVPTSNPDGTPSAVINIGKAQLWANSANLLGSSAESAGFYAISYNLNGVAGFANGTKVISYRGTDGLIDPWTGWTVRAGFAGASQAGVRPAA